MLLERQRPFAADRLHRANRAHSVVQTTIISMVALFAAVLVGLTGFSA